MRISTSPCPVNASFTPPLRFLDALRRGYTPLFEVRLWLAAAVTLQRFPSTPLGPSFSKKTVAIESLEKYVAYIFGELANNAGRL